jgi:hypothetical protein
METYFACFQGDLLPVDDLKLKKEVRDAIKATGLLISDAFLNNTTGACSGGRFLNINFVLVTPIDYFQIVPALHFYLFVDILI